LAPLRILSVDIECAGRKVSLLPHFSKEHLRKERTSCTQTHQRLSNIVATNQVLHANGNCKIRTENGQQAYPMRLSSFLSLSLSHSGLVRNGFFSTTP
jgi:hypothetical protein